MVGIQTYPAYSCAASDAACGQPWLGDKGIIDQFIAIVFYIEVRCCAARSATTPRHANVDMQHPRHRLCSNLTPLLIRVTASAITTTTTTTITITIPITTTTNSRSSPRSSRKGPLLGCSGAVRIGSGITLTLPSFPSACRSSRYAHTPYQNGLLYYE